MGLRRLRCSILAVGDFPEGGATSQRLYLLAKLLNEGSFDTSLCILHPVSKVPLKENNTTAGEWGGVKFTYLSGSIVRPTAAVAVLLDTLRGILKSLFLIASRAQDRPDVLVLYTPNFMKYIIPMIVAKLLRIPIIVEICEIFSYSTDSKEVGILRRIANSGESLMEKLIPVMSVGQLVISKRIRQYYENIGPPRKPAYMLPVLIDFERYEKGGVAAVNNLRGARFLLNSGSFNEKDGLDYLVQSVAKVRRECPEIRLVFTGSATISTQEKILEQAGPTGKDWITFTGFLSREELIWCYKNAEGLLCCRSNSDYANYGFPTKLAEYLASGRPVVATTVGDVEDYLADEDSAFLAEPENVESISHAILRLVRDPARADIVGSRGAQVARQQFDYGNYAEGVSRYIRERIGVKFQDN